MQETMGTSELYITGPAGRLQALLEGGKPGKDAGLAVICHPHPVYGGTMTNKVVHMLARAFVACGMQALRFNFRGVGESDGQFDEGEGELADTLAVFDWAVKENEARPVWLAGFSFGGAMAVRAAAERPAAGLVSVAPAIRRFASSLDRRPECPWLIIQGDRDELVDVQDTQDYVESLDPQPQLEVLRDAEHFFHGRLVELRSVVESFVGEAAG